MCVFSTCLQYVCHVWTIADFRMLLGTLFFASFFRQFAAAPNISRDMAKSMQKDLWLLLASTLKLIVCLLKMFHKGNFIFQPLIFRGGCFACFLNAFAVCFREAVVLSLCFGKTWGVEVLSDLLHRSAEICHIETPRGRKSSELQGILKMVPVAKEVGWRS